MLYWWGVSCKPNRVCPRSGDGDEWRSTLDDISQREEGRGAILLLFLDRQTCQVASPSSQGCQIGQLNRIPACRWSSHSSYPAAKSVIKTSDTHTHTICNEGSRLWHVLEKTQKILPLPSSFMCIKMRGGEEKSPQRVRNLNPTSRDPKNLKDF